MSSEKALIERNIELSGEFSRYLFEHPEVEEVLPMGSEIVLLPEFDKELNDYNARLGQDMEANNQRVVYVIIKDMRPKRLSRIKKIELRSVA
jgi:hypothetical protein